MLTVGSLFAGIGGLDLGLERAGMAIRWQVEIDDFCLKVLQKHWPNVPKYPDVRELKGDELEPVDLICGGFPCQPVSLAGRRRGQEDPRWLWPEFARIVRVVRPRYVLVENVPGLLVRGMGEVLGDLAALGYDAEWDCIPAAAVGAPHIRDRVFIVAYADGGRCEAGRELRPGRGQSDPSGSCKEIPDAHRQHVDRGRPGAGTVLWPRPQAAKLQVGEPVADADCGGLEVWKCIFVDPSPELTAAQGSGALHDTHGADRDKGWRTAPRQGGHTGISGGGVGVLATNEHWATEPDVGRVAHGVPNRVDRLRALGNAVVPQVAEWIGRRIIQAHETLWGR